LMGDGSDGRGFGTTLPNLNGNGEEIGEKIGDFNSNWLKFGRKWWKFGRNWIIDV